MRSSSCIKTFKTDGNKRSIDRSNISESLLCIAMDDFAVKTMSDMMLGRCRCAVEVLVDGR